MAFDRDELLARLAGALAENPGSTMKELAEATGISKASLHRIYTNKENICTLIVQENKRIFQELCAILQSGSPNWLAALQAAIDLLVDNRDYVRCLGRDSFWTEVTEAEWDVFDREITQFFRKGKEAGILQGDFSITDMNDIFIGLVTGMIESMSMRQSSPETVKRIVYEALLGGILRPLESRCS